MTTRVPRRIGALAIGLALVTSSAAFAADSVEEFYKKNNQITLLVGSGPGSGYETWGRLVGQYMSKYMPGNPTFLVKTMPGAGSLTMANFLFNQAPTDGTTIGVFSRNLPTQMLMGADTAKFDPREVEYIGGPEKQPTVVCASTAASGITTMEQAQQKELPVGGTGAGSGIALLPKIINAVAGTKFKLIDGYQSSGEIFLAMQRGELGGVCQGYLPIYGPNKDDVDSGKIKILFNFEEKRDPAIPNVPSVFEYIKDPENRQIMNFINSSPAIGRPFAAPKGIPADRLAALRAAFEKGVKDPGFVQDTAKAQLEAGYVSGPDMQRIVRALFETPKPVIEKASAMMPKDGG